MEVFCSMGGNEQGCIPNHYLFENKGNQKYFFIQHGGNFEPPCHKKLWLTEFDMR